MLMGAGKFECSCGIMEKEMKKIDQEISESLKYSLFYRMHTFFCPKVNKEVMQLAG